MNPIPILRFCAKGGSEGWTVPQLRKLIVYLEINEGAAPTTLLECLKLLLKEILRGIDENDINEIIQQRMGTNKLPFATALTTEALVKAHEILDDAGAKEALQELQTYIAKVESDKALLPKPKVAAKGKKKKKALAPKDCESRDKAARFAPPIAGCNLSLETEWHSRWRITYPVDEPPFCCTSSFKPECNADKKRALFEVLRWAWREHTKNSEVECPWDLAL